MSAGYPKKLAGHTLSLLEYHHMMAHVSDWHVFDPTDRGTYPKVKAPIQVRFDDGKLEEGDSRAFFPITRLLPSSSIVAWRYIKGIPQS